MLGREQSVTVQEVMEEMMSGDFPPASLSRPFAASYQVFTGEQLQSYLGVAIRKESPYYYQMKGVLEELVE